MITQKFYSTAYVVLVSYAFFTLGILVGITGERQRIAPVWREFRASYENELQVIKDGRESDYEDGFRSGVDCRAIMSAPACELLLEKTK